MADNDVTKKILIDVKLRRDQVKSDIVGLNSDLDKLLIQQQRLSGANKQNTTEYIGLQSQIRLAKAEIRDANKQVDSITKAINSENNSLSQNRALLSVLTAQYVKLSQEEGKTAKSTVDLGKTISDLTVKLKAQEKQIGQTYRNVGNYEEAFKNALDGIGQYIPGFQKFNTAITAAVKGFGFLPNAADKSQQATARLNQTIGFLPQNINQATESINQFSVKGEKAAGSITDIAEATPAAEEGLSGMAVSGGILAGTLAVIAGFVLGLIEYMKNLDGVTDVVEQGWAGLKASFFAAGAAIQEGKWGDIARNMSEAAVEAYALTDALQTLGDQQLAYSVEQKKNEEQIGLLQLKLRNKRNTPEQEQKYYNDIQNIGEENYKKQKELADKQYNLAVVAATVGRYLTKEEIKNLKEKGVAYAIELENENKILSKQTQGIAAAQNAQTEAEQYYLTVKQRSQNRIDAYNAKQDAAAQKELETLQKIKEATIESDNVRIASIAKRLQFQQDSFGKEISEIDEHYRQLIFKQEQFIEKQQQLVNNPKSSPKVKAAAGKAVATGKKTIESIRAEQYIATEKLLVEHNKSMINEAQKSALELRAIQITNIQDTQKREIATANNDMAIKQQQYNIELANIQDNINKINNELTADSEKKKGDKSRYTDEEIQALKTTLNAQLALLGDNSDKRIALEKATNIKIDEINRQAANSKLASQDKVALLQAQDKGGKNNPFNQAEQAAKHKQLMDEYNAEVSNQSLTDDAKLALEAQYLAADREMTEQNEKAKRDIIINAAQEVSKVAFTLLSNNIRSQAEFAQQVLERTKEHELANTSLTSAQKLSINDKYRKLEGAEKVKEFKANQKLAIAQAIMNGALAEVKTFAELGWPAGIAGMIAIAAITTAQVVAIAKQKPPAFATGGQFVSDGKGAVLPGYSRKDNVNAQLRSGEAVVVSEAMKNPYARNLVSAVNVAFGGKDFSVPNSGRGYAIGGLVTDGGNSNRYYAQPEESTQSLANHVAYSLINNFPPIYVSVKDVNNQQSILARTVNRVIL